jgi:glycosyltransferase involved in cell wall biosynthesis
MKRIVMIGTDFEQRGGISTVVTVYRDSGWLARRGIEYLASHRSGSRWSKLFGLVRAWCRFALRLARRQVSLVHVHSATGPSYWRKLLFIVPALVLRRPLVLHLHSGIAGEYFGAMRPPSAALARWVLESSAQVIVLSRQTAVALRDFAPRVKVQVVPNPAPPRLSAHDGLPADLAPRVLFLGAFDVAKGIDDLIEAFSKLHRSHPRAVLCIGGSGVREPLLRRKAELCLPAGAVTFAGWVTGESKARLLAGASLLALPSYVEGMSMVLLEAVEYGLPVVCTPVGANTDIVEHGVNGLHVTPGDVDGLARAISRLLDDDAERRRMAAASRERAGAFAIDAITARLDQIHADALGPRDQVAHDIDRIAPTARSQ